MPEPGHWVPGGERHLIAHRGASLFAPENSPEAVRQAAARGATDVEVDVNMTADGVLLAVHDGVVAGGGVRWISQMTEAEVRAAAAEAEAPDPPRLDDVLAVVAEAGLGIYLDVKQLLPGGPVVLGDLLRAHGLADHAVGASFRADLAGRLKSEAGLTTSLLFHDPGIDVHSLVRGLDLDFVHPCYDVFGAGALAPLTEAWVAAVRATGAGIVGWNTLDPAVAAAVFARGADGVCSDDPAVLVEAVATLA
ncbi:glycerophosphodiester phosphodiesterase [Iamia sp. SCSIO 61187]|uniref:glycerophosphodiester phosphodiesterase n=1 Tax=Iamia sp. SCSIO 61187 TaxID=2722752 RepID=UPI001C636D7B|nr:glycerophosphodiester phosphodiesterase [Iamia sp. SCSIO 61187]QYG93821.1 glycerophosphodiester phosphodiesterase [Iamia sp. SCSIO 61187]